MAFVVVLAIAEQMGLSRGAIGIVFLIATVALYAGIGIMSRTNDAAEYYVAGRRVPAVYNGMATGADWMSAASFIGMAGTLYLTGYGGLAFIMGWTGGYCLVALFLAPYLRKFGQFTIPDFLGARYEGNAARFVGILIAILVSFVYVVAQIYGVGLITTRLTGLAFEIGVFVGLGGILVCSFLGGMRAVTWTQVAQYIILIIAYMIPVVWLSVKQTGVPIPQAIYGAQLQKVTEREAQLIADPKELEVRAVFKQRSDDLAAKLQPLTADGLKLEMLSNRGMKVWPGGMAETATVDVYRCRFQLPDGTPGSIPHSVIVSLLDRVTKAGIEFVKLEGLYNFDGKPGFSRGQGQ
jgi:cation/acetate symporter